MLQTANMQDQSPIDQYITQKGFITHRQRVALDNLCDAAVECRRAGLSISERAQQEMQQQLVVCNRVLGGTGEPLCASVEFAEDNTDPTCLRSAKKYYEWHHGVSQQVNGGTYYACRREVNLAAAPCCSPRYCYEYYWGTTAPPQEEQAQFLEEDEDIYGNSASTCASYDAYTLSELMHGPQ